MTTPKDHLIFPSGRSVGNCRKDAKRLSQKRSITLHEALDAVARSNGSLLDWAKAVSHDCHPRTRPSAPLPHMTRIDIEGVIERYQSLTHFGFGVSLPRGASLNEQHKLFEDNRRRLLDAVDECNRAYLYLLHVTKRKTINSVGSSSYGLKHRVEEYWNALDPDGNSYVANGIFLGFKFKRALPLGPNVMFNMSERSPIFEWSRLRSRLKHNWMHDTSKEQAKLRQLDEQLGIKAALVIA